MGDRVDQQLGNYRLVRLLGRGSFAEVYLGEHTRLKSYAALKVLHRFLSEDDQEDFLSEGQTLVRLKHQHIVRLLDFDIEDDTPFLVMEYAPGGTLRKLHPKGSRLPLEKVVAYVRQMAEALDYAHALSIIHRDIKPENMLLGAQGEVLLSDFGIATIAHATRSFQTERHQAGTLPYMAPEQLQKHPRPASDQYALAVLAYEWLCGERPFGGTEWTLIYQHMHMPPPPLLEKLPDLPPEVEGVIGRALAKDPHERYTSVGAFAQALACAAGEDDGSYSHINASDTLTAPTSPLFTKGQHPPDFSTFVQEQSPAASSVAIISSARVSSTPDPSLPSDPSARRSGKSQLGQSRPNQMESSLSSQSRSTSWLDSTWTQRLILLLLALSLIAASTDIAFTLANWQHMAQDDHVTRHVDPTEWRQKWYKELVHRKPSREFPLNGREAEVWDQGPECLFAPDGYHIRAGIYLEDQDCMALSTNYEDFAFQAQMTILSGTGGGLIFRAYLEHSQLYRFQITTDGSYVLAVEPGNDGVSGKSTVVKTGYHQTNTITVIARNRQILLYINGHYVDHLHDSQSLSGSIGLFTVHNRGSPMAEVVFRDAKLWIL